MNKRLAMLEQMVASGAADSFARYALAMEYRKEERPGDAATAFEALRAADPEYLPMYLMAGQLFATMAELEKAGEWLRAGIALAEKKGDGKTLGELQDALSDLAD